MQDQDKYWNISYFTTQIRLDTRSGPRLGQRRRPNGSVRSGGDERDACCGRRAAGDDLRLEEQLVGGDRRTLDLSHQQLDRGSPDCLDRLANRCQRRVSAAHEGGVVVPDDRDVCRHRQPGTPGRADRTEREWIAGADDPRHPVPDEPRRCGMPSLQGEPRALDQLAGERVPGRASRDRLERSQLATGRDMVGWPEDEPDPLVAQVGEMTVGLLHRDRVVRRHPREVKVLRSGIDEDDR
jgi:hypothetical protein